MVTERRPVTKGWWILVLLALVVIAAVAVVVIYPDILKDVLIAAVYIAVVIIAVAVIGMIAMGLIAIPLYFKKGEEVQTDGKYSVDDQTAVGDVVRSEEDRRN